MVAVKPVLGRQGKFKGNRFQFTSPVGVLKPSSSCTTRVESSRLSFTINTRLTEIGAKATKVVKNLRITRMNLIALFVALETDLEHLRPTIERAKVVMGEDVVNRMLLPSRLIRLSEPDRKCVVMWHSLFIAGLRQEGTSLEQVTREAVDNIKKRKHLVLNWEAEGWNWQHIHGQRITDLDCFSAIEAGRAVQSMCREKDVEPSAELAIRFQKSICSQFWDKVRVGGEFTPWELSVLHSVEIDTSMLSEPAPVADSSASAEVWAAWARHNRSYIRWEKLQDASWELASKWPFSAENLVEDPLRSTEYFRFS